ncbi:hypothetical protein ACFVWN_06440 [Nocardiopsis flavescens]|uniref:hypothetical protein n=1 Tax=Nocardiopsis flavescens TaxID=758803 RepID=UPI00364EAA33
MPALRGGDADFDRDGRTVAIVTHSRAYRPPDSGTGMLLTEGDTGAHDALVAWSGADAADPVPRIRGHRPPGPGRLPLCTGGLWCHLPGPDGLVRPAHPAGEESGDVVSGVHHLCRSGCARCAAEPLCRTSLHPLDALPADVPEPRHLSTRRLRQRIRRYTRSKSFSQSPLPRAISQVPSMTSPSAENVPVNR